MSSEPYFDEWLSVHFRELFASGDPDGIWVDGDWVGPCYCCRCAGRYRKEHEFAGDIPDGADWNRYWAQIKLKWTTRLNGRAAARRWPGDGSHRQFAV